ncbi:MAG: threonine synthase, partial [Burkholderiales bacterium]
KACFETLGEIIDPHTADGLNVAKQFVEPGIPMVVLETALPIKFSDVIHEAIGAAPPIPDKFKHLQTSALRYEAMPVNTPLVKSFIAKHCD